MNSFPHPRKRFGQHFLHDSHVIERIIHAANPSKEDHFVEIGPGLGALTLHLLPKVAHLDVVEFDRDIIPVLKKQCRAFDNLTIHQADALQFDFAALRKEQSTLRVIGNLPYNISTPLLFHLLQQASAIQDMHFMLQKEVVDRMAAIPCTKAYGRLSIMLQYYCKVETLFAVGSQAFSPPPRVESAVVRLTPYVEIPFPSKNFHLLEDIVRTAFSYRRKTLHNALKEWVTLEQWQVLGIDANLRPEQISVEEYVRISNTVLPSTQEH